MPQTQAEFISISHQRRGGRNSFQSRRRRDEPLRLLVIFSLMFFVFSCAKDQQESDAIIHSATNLPVTSYSESNGVPLDAGLPIKMNEPGCHCYLRVNSMEVAITNGRWALFDVNDPYYGFEIIGTAPNSWNTPGDTLRELPSDFFELDSPSFGIHTFTLSNFFGGLTPGDKVHTEVRCVNIDKHGSIQYKELVYYPTLEYGQGTPNSTFDGEDFVESFSCWSGSSSF